MLWGQALAGACGRQLHRAALNVFYFVQREEPPPAAPRSHRQSCPSGRCHYGTFHYPQLSCLSASSRQSLTPSSQSSRRRCRAHSRSRREGLLYLSVSLYLFYRQSRVHRVLEGLGPRFRTLYTSLQEVGARAPRRVELLFSLLRCRRTTPWPGARLWRKQGGSTFGVDSAQRLQRATCASPTSVAKLKPGPWRISQAKGWGRR
jgi:hypothetical protein